MIGRTVSHYKVLEKLGGGAMGVVYKGEDLKLKRPVALKFLPPKLTRKPESKEYFIQEARAASALDHANVCVVHQIEETEDGQIFMVLTFYEGETLKKKIQRGPLKLEEAIDIAIQVAQGLAKAHEMGIVHRDIKPANLMITRDGVVKIVDFGLAKLAGEHRRARSGTVTGTLAYMSPEQAGGESTDHRTDIWSLGVVLYEMLAGELPFKGEYEQAIVYSILNEKQQPISALRKDIPPELENIVNKAMEKLPEFRFQQVTELLMRLKTLKGKKDAVSAVSARRGETDANPNNLPLQLTSFVGRDQQMTEVKRLLAENRLLSLTGAGGCGKTRLSLQVARDTLPTFPDGIWMVELAAITDPSLVPQMVITTLGLKEEPGRLLTQTLVDHLKSKNLLIILDNCEHLISACAELVDFVLRSCSGLRFLTTSREGLGITGEVIYQVPPLVVPGTEEDIPLKELRQIEAVRLFVERANAVRKGFNLSQENRSTIVQICRRLDGIPLALELAAARIGVLVVEEISKRLDDIFGLLTSGSKTSLPRHQTLRALIDWSYDLLPEPEQKLFRRLSVFAGSWALDSAEAVCSGNGIQESEFLDLHSRLVSKSLVEMEAERRGSTEEARYRMLGIIQEYARYRLEEEEGAEIWHRHRDYFLALAEESVRQLTGPEQRTWTLRLEAEHENLRTALEGYSGEGSDALLAMQMAGALGRYFFVRGHWTEGRNILSEILALPENRGPTEFRARALDWTGWLAYWQSDYQQALALLEESLSIWRKVENNPGMAQALNNLGAVAMGQGNYDQARAYHEESLAIRRRYGDQRSIAVSLHNLGEVHLSQGNYDQARAYHEESLALFQKVGHIMGVADSLSNLGAVAEGQGDFDQAQACYEQSLKNRRDRQDPMGIAESLHNLGALAERRGECGKARAYYEQSLTIRRKLGDRMDIADSLERLGTLAAVCGESGRAAKLLSAAKSLRVEINAPTSPAKQQKLNRAISETRSELGEEVFSKEWEKGQAMSLEQSIDYALSKDG